MKHFICTTCGTQYPLSQEAPAQCKTCGDQRQYVNPAGQSWTTLEEMRESKKFTNGIIYAEEGLYSLTTRPEFAIGQTA